MGTEQGGIGKGKRGREGEGRSEVKCPEIYLSPPGNPIPEPT